MSLLLALLSPAWAADIIVPDATPASMSDLSVASLFSGFVVSALENKGLDVDDGDEIREWAGDAADACSDIDECPGNLFPKTNARMAVVLSVGQSSKGLIVEAKLYGAEDKSPLKVVRETVPGGGEMDFSKRLAKTAAEMLPLIPEREEERPEEPEATGSWSERYAHQDEEDEPAPKSKSSSSKSTSSKSKYSDDEEEEEEEPAPKSKSSSSKSTSSKSKYSDEEEEEEPKAASWTSKYAAEEKEELDEPVAKSTKSTKSKSSDDEEDEEEDEPKAKSTASKASTSKSAKSSGIELDDDFAGLEDADEEDLKPVVKAPPPPPPPEPKATSKSSKSSKSSKAAPPPPKVEPVKSKAPDVLSFDEEDDEPIIVPEEKPKATGPKIDLYEDDDLIPKAKEPVKAEPAKVEPVKAAAVEPKKAEAPKTASKAMDPDDLEPVVAKPEAVIEAPKPKVVAAKPLDLEEEEEEEGPVVAKPEAVIEAPKVKEAPAPKSTADSLDFDDEDEDEPRASTAKVEAPKVEPKKEVVETKAKTAAKTAEPPKAKEKAEKPAKVVKVVEPKKAEPPKTATKIVAPKEDTSASAKFASDSKAVDERSRMGVPWSDYAKYKASGLDQKAWLDKAQVHAGHPYVELVGGYALGDVDRGYGVRVGINEEFVSTGVSSWTGSGTAATGGGLTGRIAVGYVPTWFLDTQVAVGIQSGQKHLNVGWYCGSACDDASEETQYTAVDATQLTIEPRARILPLATGFVKPYGLVGFDISLYDSFHIPDENSSVKYPDAAGGASFGPTLGAGVMIDPMSPISIVVEVPFTLVLADGTTATTDDSLSLSPTTLDKSGWILRIVGGVQVRL